MAHSSWGPKCNPATINTNFYVDHKYGKTRFPAGVRNELSELYRRLIIETVNRGYRMGTPNDPSYGCWGYYCKGIEGTSSPSNHSWGLAVDINAPTNPFSNNPNKWSTDMPGWMPDLWNAYGFRWGGDYTTRKDAMHYEFTGSLADANNFTNLARTNRLGEGGQTQPKPPDQGDFDLSQQQYDAVMKRLDAIEKQVVSSRGAALTQSESKSLWVVGSAGRWPVKPQGNMDPHEISQWLNVLGVTSSVNAVASDNDYLEAVPKISS